MTVLLTGGAGFIGSHLADRLVARGERMVVVDSFEPNYPREVKEANLAGVVASPLFRLVEADVADLAALERALGDEPVDLVVHLAARAGVRPSIEAPGGYVDANVQGTLSLLELARRRGARSFVFGSSSSVYGDATPVPFEESSAAVSPISPYAATKRAAELLCHTYHHLYGLSVVCLRFFTVYGPRQRPDLAIHKFARLMLRGEEIPFFGDGSTERDYTYVDDIVQGVEGAIDYLARTPAAFEIVNLGESRTVSLSELVTLLARELGMEPRLKRLPAQPGDVERTYASVARARELLGYAPAVPIEEGIRRFVAWLRESERR